MPELTVIVPVYNCPVETRAFLESLSTVKQDFELIIVDDCSEEDTVNLLREYSADHDFARLILNGENQGFAKNCNQAANEARSEVLAFLNNDLILTEGWLEPMLTQLSEGENVGVVGNVQINPNTKRLDHAGMFFHIDGIPRHARKGCRKPPSEPVRQWRCVTAACILVRRDTFLGFGGFDEGYVNGCEDIDLCVRMTLEGLKHYVCNKSIVYHHVSASVGRNKFNNQNVRRFLERWQGITLKWGEEEWAKEYLHCYKHKWWKIEPKLLPSLFKNILM